MPDKRFGLADIDPLGREKLMAMQAPETKTQEPQDDMWNEYLRQFLSDKGVDTDTLGLTAEAIGKLAVSPEQLVTAYGPAATSPFANIQTLLSGVGRFGKEFAAARAARAPKKPTIGEALQMKELLKRPRLSELDKARIAEIKAKIGKPSAAGQVTEKTLFSESTKRAYEEVVGISLEQWIAGGGNAVEWWTNAKAKADPIKIRKRAIELFNIEAPTWGIGTVTMPEAYGEPIQQRGFVPGKTFAITKKGKEVSVDNADEFNRATEAGLKIIYR